MALQSGDTKVSDTEWSRHKEIIIDLYLTENLNLEKLAEEMRTRHSFTASLSQFELQLKAWKARKNLKAHEWKPILDRLDSLPLGTQGRVVISGRAISKERLHRARRHCRKKYSTSSNSQLRKNPHYNPNTARLFKEVSIETQDENGRWSQLDNCSPTESITDQDCHPDINDGEQPPKPGGELILNDGVLFENFRGSLITPFLVSQNNPQLIPRRLNGFEFPQHHTSPSPRQASIELSSATTRMLSDHLVKVPVSYALDNPFLWLHGLPSRSIEDCVAESDGIPKAIVGEIIKASTKCQMVDGHFSSLNLTNKVQKLISLLPDGDIQGDFRENRPLISMRDILETNFIRLVIISLTNGFAGLENIPPESLVKVLGRGKRATSLLSNILLAGSKQAVKSWGCSVFQVAIKARETRIVKHLLEIGLADVNDTICVDRGSRVTPIELAAILGDMETMNILVNAGADINKTYTAVNTYGGAFYRLWVNGPSSGATDHPVEFASLVKRLLALGAIVTPEIINRGYALFEGFGTTLCHPLASHISPSQHPDFLRGLYATDLFLKLEGKVAAEIMGALLSDCVIKHQSDCIRECQTCISCLLYEASIKGAYYLVRTLDPYSNSIFDNWSDCALSAAVRGGNNDLINFAMAKRPNINPSHDEVQLDLSLLNKQKDLNIPMQKDLDIPLAEAIRAKNQSLVNTFEQAGIFQSLHEGGRFSDVLAAATEIGDRSLVTKLLECCPDIQAQNISDAVAHAIRIDDEALLTLLLEKADFGADQKYSPHYKSLLAIAINHKSRYAVYAVLKAGALTIHDADDITTLEKALEWGDRSIVTELMTIFGYPSRHRSEISRQDFIPLRGELAFGPRAPSRARVIRNILGNAPMMELVLNSKLATQEYLTDFLFIAIYDEDYTMAERLIRAGADTSNESLVEIAVQGRPKALQTLMENLKPKPIMSKRGRLAILKGAIKGELGPALALKNLVKSGLFTRSDLFDLRRVDPDSTFNCDSITSLGEAVAASKTHPDLGIEMVSLFLNTGCDPNGIVESFGGPGRYCISQTALLKAIETENKEVIQILIQHGANINAEATYAVRRTPLQKAAEIGSLDIVRLLLKQGADVNAQPSFSLGGTALQFAAISGNCNIAAELLSHGASLYMAPAKVGGRFPLEGAAEHGRLDMIQFLWKAKENIVVLEDVERGFQDENIRRAMRLAAQNAHMGCRDLIADLSGLPITAGDLPPVVSPMYVDWPPQEL